MTGRTAITAWWREKEKEQEGKRKKGERKEKEREKEKWVEKRKDTTRRVNFENKPKKPIKKETREKIS